MDLTTIVKIAPPAMAIVLVLVTKSPTIGLITGVLLGTLFVTGLSFDFFTTLFTNLAGIAQDLENVKLIIGLLCLGAFIGVVEAAIYKKEMLSNLFNSKRNVLLAGWFTGMILFIDDYVNILLNGMFLKSLSKKFGISKEKIAFVIHSLGVSSCVLIPFSTWSIFIAGVANSVPGVDSGITLFVQSIPFNFYSIALVLTTLTVIIFEIDILMMKKVEGAIDETIDDHAVTQISAGKVLLPTFVLISLAVLLIITAMRFSFSLEQVAEVQFINILILTSVASSCFALFYYHITHVVTVGKMLRSMKSGIKQMAEMSIILILAWMLGVTTAQLGTADALIGFAQGFMTPSLLTFLTFIVTATVAFMASSWATFAILIPIMIPLGVGLGVNPAFILAAIVSGGVFGDHMSPISSTSILTKAVSKSDMHLHFRSQLPYSVIAFVISGYLFFLIGRF